MASSTRTMCSPATSPGWRRVLPTWGTSRGSCSLAPPTEPRMPRASTSSSADPEVSAGNGSVMYCAPLGVAYADRSGGTAHARAGALRHHALGRTLPDRLSRGHARGRVARARRAWRARGDRRGDRGRGPRGRRGARVPGGAGRSRASDRRPGHGVHVLHGRARAAGRRRAGRGSRRVCVTWSRWAGTPTRTPRWRARSSARSTAGADSPRRGSSAWSTASALETDALALADLAGRRTRPGPGE